MSFVPFKNTKIQEFHKVSEIWKIFITYKDSYKIKFSYIEDITFSRAYSYEYDIQKDLLFELGIIANNGYPKTTYKIVNTIGSGVLFNKQMLGL